MFHNEVLDFAKGRYCLAAGCLSRTDPIADLGSLLLFGLYLFLQALDVGGIGPYACFNVFQLPGFACLPDSLGVSLIDCLDGTYGRNQQDEEDDSTDD